MGKCFTICRDYQRSEEWMIEVVDPEWTAEEVFEALECGEIDFYPEVGRIVAGHTLVARADLDSQFDDDERYELIAVDEDNDDEVDAAAEASGLRLFGGGEEPGPEGDADLTANPEPAGGQVTGADHQHEWVAFSTALAERWIMVQCVECGTHGAVEDPTREEWGEAFHAPSRPYCWHDDKRVTVKGPGNGFLLRHPQEGPSA